jgi:hypothetical protein
MTTTVYGLLRQRCGLRQVDAAALHNVREDTIKSWDSGRRALSPAIIDELRRLYQLIAYAAGTLGAKIDALKRSEGEPVVIGLAHDDKDARALGFPAPAPTRPRSRWRSPPCRRRRRWSSCRELPRRSPPTRVTPCSRRCGSMMIKCEKRSAGGVCGGGDRNDPRSDRLTQQRSS